MKLNPDPLVISIQPFSQEKFHQKMYHPDGETSYPKFPPCRQYLNIKVIRHFILFSYYKSLFMTHSKFQESNRLWPIQWLYPCSYCGKIQTYLCSCGWCGSVYCWNQWTTCCWSNSRPNIPGIFLKDTKKIRFTLMLHPNPRLRVACIANLTK